MSRRQLEIGPGDHPLPGFDCLDCNPSRGIDFVASWGYERLPIEDASYDFVFASHVLEHIPWYRTGSALVEAYRILDSQGIIEVWVPNFAYVIECYLEGVCGDQWRRFNPHSHPMLWVNGRTFTYGPTEDNWHRACFDEAYLSECLCLAGFQYISRVDGRTLGVSHGPIDLGMRGRKV